MLSCYPPRGATTHLATKRAVAVGHPTAPPARKSSCGTSLASLLLVHISSIKRSIRAMDEVLRFDCGASQTAALHGAKK